MAVIGCDIPVRVGGAEIIGTNAGVWLKTHFRQDGHHLVATTYLVAAGNPSVFELRIDLRPLEKAATAIHAALHQKTNPTVGFSFKKAWRGIKKTAKKIGKSKLIKAVGKVTTAVVKSKITGGLVTALAVAVPAVGVPALAAYGAANAAIKAVGEGKKLVNTATEAKRIISKGNAIAKRAVTIKQDGAAKAKAELAKKTPAATGIAKQIAASVAKVQAQAKASPAVVRALAVRKRLSDPKVKAQLLAIKARADSAKKALDKVAFDSVNATGAKRKDALQSRAIINLVAQNNLRLAAIAQKNAGGLPALLIDPKGKITRGRYTVKAQAAARGKGDVAYFGPGNVQRGTFTKVAGEYDIIGDDLSDFAHGAGYEEIIGSRGVVDLRGASYASTIGATRPPPRPSQTRQNVINQWLLAQDQKGKLRPSVGGCFQVPNMGRKSLRISGAPDLIGCVGNPNCACDAPGV